MCQKDGEILFYGMICTNPPCALTDLHTQFNEVSWEKTDVVLVFNSMKMFPKYLKPHDAFIPFGWHARSWVEKLFEMSS